jgi:hypothetical protein
VRGEGRREKGEGRGERGEWRGGEKGGEVGKYSLVKEHDFIQHQSIHCKSFFFTRAQFFHFVHKFVNIFRFSGMCSLNFQTLKKIINIISGNQKSRNGSPRKIFEKLKNFTPRSSYRQQILIPEKITTKVIFKIFSQFFFVLLPEKNYLLHAENYFHKSFLAYSVRGSRHVSYCDG